MQHSKYPLCSTVAVLFLCSLLPLLTPASLPVYPLDTAAVRQVVEAAMKCQSVRQFHAAVVHRDKEILKLQLELQSDGQISGIDGKLMYLASVSKGMFGTGLVRVEQHLRTVLKNDSFSLFNTPIRQLLNDENFWFLDPVRSALVTIDDMVSHRTGLARHDAMWYLKNWESKEEFMKHIARLEATSEFRNSFVYNNLVWTVADMVVQKLTSRTFVQYMREHLWRPLGMNNTYGSSEMNTKLLSHVDFSQGYRPMGMPLPVTLMERSTKVLEAAGGIMTSLTDMMQYMKLHANHNYSASQPVPGQFLPLNANAASSGFSSFFNKELYNPGIENLPEWEIESYTRGWMRSWYRNHLDFSHGGSLLGVRCELDVYSKQNLAVFNHMTLGPASSLFQSAYPVVINKYLSDILITNQSHVNKDNVCSLFINITNPGNIRLPRRALSGREIEMLKGSYGNYGFGKVQMSYNQTTSTMILYYGFAVIELIPITLKAGQNEPYQFYLNLIEPVEFGSINNIVNRTDDAIEIPTQAAQNPQSFMTVSQIAGGKLALEAPAFEAGIKLIKDLEPSTWTPPKGMVCKSGVSAFAGSSVRLGLATSAVAMILAAFGTL